MQRAYDASRKGHEDHKMKLRETPNQIVRVVARDAESGKSKTLTVYDTTPEEVIDRLSKAIASDEQVEESESSAVNS